MRRSSENRRPTCPRANHIHLAVAYWPEYARKSALNRTSGTPGRDTQRPGAESCRWSLEAEGRPQSVRPPKPPRSSAQIHRLGRVNCRGQKLLRRIDFHRSMKRRAASADSCHSIRVRGRRAIAYGRVEIATSCAVGPNGSASNQCRMSHPRHVAHLLKPAFEPGLRANLHSCPTGVETGWDDCWWLRSDNDPVTCLSLG